MFLWSTSNWICTVPGYTQVSFLHRDALPQSHALPSELKASFISKLLCTQWSIFNHSPLFLSLTHRDSFTYAHSQRLKNPIAGHRVPKRVPEAYGCRRFLGKLHSQLLCSQRNFAQTHLSLSVRLNQHIPGNCVHREKKPLFNSLAISKEKTITHFILPRCAAVPFKIETSTAKTARRLLLTCEATPYNRQLCSETKKSYLL